MGKNTAKPLSAEELEIHDKFVSYIHSLLGRSRLSRKYYFNNLAAQKAPEMGLVLNDDGFWIHPKLSIHDNN